jgi:hypothetical protein
MVVLFVNLVGEEQAAGDPGIGDASIHPDHVWRVWWQQAGRVTVAYGGGFLRKI